MSSIRKDLFLGIDIGAGAIKIVLLNREKSGRLKLAKVAYEEYEYNPQSDLKQQAANLASILKNFLRKEKITQKAKIGLSITGQATFIRLVKIPDAAPKKLRQIVLYETQQQVPFPIKDVVWDFQIYERDKKQLSVLLAAVKKELITSISKVLEECLISSEFIDVSNLALYNCLQYFFRDLKQTLILDIGAKTTNVIVVNSRKLWTRSLPIGGEEITDNIARKLNIERGLAEKLKKEKGTVLMLLYGKNVSGGQDEKQKIAEAITDVLTDLTSEIVKTLNFYKAQHDSKMELKRVLLTGGVSKIENIDKFLENSLSLPTEKIDFFNFLNLAQEVDVKLNEFLGPAIGLALRGFHQAFWNINLEPQEQLTGKRFIKKRPFIIFSFLLIFFILLGDNVFLAKKYSLAKTYLKRLNNAISQYEQNKESVDKLKTELAIYENKLRTIDAISTRRYLAVTILDNIAAAMPDSIWGESLNINTEENYILLEGSCSSDLNDIGLFESNLKAKKDIFEDVKIQKVAKGKDNKISFSLKIVIKLLTLGM